MCTVLYEQQQLSEHISLSFIVGGIKIKQTTDRQVETINIQHNIFVFVIISYRERTELSVNPTQVLCLPSIRSAIVSHRPTIKIVYSRPRTRMARTVDRQRERTCSETPPNADATRVESTRARPYTATQQTWHRTTQRSQRTP